MEIIQWINVSVSSNVYPEPSPVSVLFFNWISDGGDGKDIEDITWPRGEKKFIVECWNIFLHKKINFVSPRSHVIFFLSYKMWRFSEDFRPLSSEGQTKIFRKSSTDLAIALSLGFLLLGILAESRSNDTQVFLAVINLKQQKYVSLETA